MHFLNMYFDNARDGGRGELKIERSGDEIARWTILEEGPRGLELLRLISLACAGSRVVPRLDFDLRALCRERDRPLQLELVLALHPPYEASRFKQGPITIGIRMNGRGEIIALKRNDFRMLSPQGPVMKAKTGLGSSAFFLLGYAPYATCHEGTDDFDFRDPYFRFTRRVFHFSLRDNRNLEEVRRKYQMFGFTSRDNVEFVCMYGFDTTLAQDADRFRFLRSLPGAYVFVQPYRPVSGGPPANLKGFFDERADALIDDLIRIVFPQNMKSMENYYRWVSRLYARAFGRPHMGLIDTIFKYNHREKRSHYLASLRDEVGPRLGPENPDVILTRFL